MSGIEIILLVAIVCAFISIVTGACADHERSESKHHANDIYVNPIRDELRQINNDKFK